MAGVSTEQGGSKLDTELNLVPFIDLLSTLVLFLLVTAVWLQVAAIPASVQSKGKSAAAAVNQQKLLIHVTRNGFRLTWPASLAGSFPAAMGKTAKGYDHDRLISALKKAAQTGKLPMAAVSADDDVSYGNLVQAVDDVKSAGGISVALSTN